MTRRERRGRVSRVLRALGRVVLDVAPDVLEALEDGRLTAQEVEDLAGELIRSIRARLEEAKRVKDGIRTGER